MDYKDKVLLKPRFKELFEKMNVQLLNNYHNEFYDENNKYNKINLKNKRLWDANRKSEVDPIFITTKSLLDEFERGLLLLEGKLDINPRMKKSKIIELLEQGKLDYYIHKKHRHSVFFIINHIIKERDNHLKENVNPSKVRLSKSDVDENFFFIILEIVGQFVSETILDTKYERVRRINILVGYILTFCGFFNKMSEDEENKIDAYKTHLNLRVEKYLDLHVEKRNKSEKMKDVEELTKRLSSKK
jgi:hypothetical protein